MPLKVLRLLPSGVLGGYLSDLITAIEYAVNNGARIVHIGPRIDDENVTEEQLELLRNVIDDAVSQGVLVVAGTGDLAMTELLFPAGFENVVAVGATNQRNEHAWFSNSGPGIDLVAPGELILSTCVSAPYCIGSGTSLAAAHVDGVAALIWSVNPDLTPAEVRAALQDSAVDLGAPGYDEVYGHGQLDAAQAVAQTPHSLYVSTANAGDPHALVFLLDNQDKHACQRIWNAWTGPYTWTVEADSKWLTVERIDGSITDPVPSAFQVCVDAEAFSGPGTYETALNIQSTLDQQASPVEIGVTAVYHRRLSRVRLSFIQRP
ncbi:MAG: Subtilisin BL [Anaerolineales bacterium]|nr:Subtilisin BL [Anaerolineales bacterium]